VHMPLLSAFQGIGGPLAFFLSTIRPKARIDFP
jgi:hypothetical protein